MAEVQVILQAQALIRRKGQPEPEIVFVENREIGTPAEYEDFRRWFAGMIGDGDMRMVASGARLFVGNVVGNEYVETDEEEE